MVFAKAAESLSYGSAQVEENRCPVMPLSRAGKKSAWYCDSVGFEEVPEFLEEYHHE